MSPMNDRELARKLRAGKTPEPPPGLLEELRRQLPAQIEAPAPRPASRLLPFRRPLSPRVWLAAASVAMVLGSGTLVWVALQYRVVPVEAFGPRERSMQVAKPPADAGGGSAEAMQPRDRRPWGDAGERPPAAMPAPAPASPGRFGEAREEAIDMLEEDRPSTPAARPIQAHDQIAATQRWAGEAGRMGGLVSAEARGTGTLKVIARDEEGAPLPGVTVAATGPTGTRVQITNEQGEARLTELPAGSYDLKAQLEGFHAIDLDGVDVSPQGRTDVEARLDAAAQGQLTVTAESPMLGDKSVSAGARVAQRELEKDSLGRGPWGHVESSGVSNAGTRVAGYEDKERAVRERPRRQEAAAATVAEEVATAPEPSSRTRPALPAAAPPPPSAPAPAPEPTALTKQAGAAPPPATSEAKPSDQPHEDASFRGDGTTPFVESENAALSTFALEVDTGSSDLVAGSLDKGRLPPAEAVRVEELVNAFDYDDQPPPKEDFALIVEGAPDPWARDNRHVLVRFVVKAREARVPGRRSGEEASESAGESSTVALEAHAQVWVDPHYVSRWRLLGYEGRDLVEDRFHKDSLDAVEVGAGRAITALYELELRPPVPPSATLAELYVRWKPVSGGVSRWMRRPLREGDLAVRWEQTSRAFRLATLVGRFAEVLRGSYWASATDDELADLARRAGAVIREWPRQPEVQDLVRRIEKARDLRRETHGKRP